MSARQKPLKIRVTFPNGKIICYAIVEKTLIETLKEIGSNHFKKINLKVGHLPLISKVKHTKYYNWMKPIADGWYINTQSDTNQKYMQLIAIKNQLKLDITIELSRDFETQPSKTGNTRIKTKDRLRVIMDGTDVTTEPYFVYFSVLRKIGFEAIRKKNLSIQDQKIVTSTKQFGYRQIQTDDYQWVTLPPKESLVINWISTVASVMNFNVTLIDLIRDKEYHFPKTEQNTTKLANIIITSQRSSPLPKDSLPAFLDSNPREEKEEKVPKKEISRKRLEVTINGMVFHVDDYVLHELWGEGVIEEITTNGALIGVKFSSMNLTYVPPQTLVHINKQEVNNYRQKELENNVPFKRRGYEPNELEANARLIRKLMRNGVISLGGKIYSPEYGSGIIRDIDSFHIKASFNNEIKTLHIGKDYIQI